MAVLIRPYSRYVSSSTICWQCRSSGVVRVQDAKGGGDGFEVQKYGDGRVALIGEGHCHDPAAVRHRW